MAGGMSPWSSTTLVNIDGGLLDPDTLPDVAGGGPTEVPTDTPALIVTGGPDFFVLRTEDASDSWAWIEYHVSTTDGFVPVAGDASTMIGSTRGVLVSNQLPSGDAYQLGTDYYFAAIAVNELGPAPTPSATVGARLDPSAIQEIITSEIVAGFILAGRVQFGQGYIDADEGIVLPQPDGTTTRFPVDGITPSTISGFLIANGMVVKDSAYFYGLTQLSGELRLNQGVPDPRNAPSVSWSVPSVDARDSVLAIASGLTLSPDGTEMVSLVSATSPPTLLVWDKATSPADTGRLIYLGGLPANPMGAGCTTIGNEYFILLNKGTIASPSYDVYVYSSTAVDAAVQEDTVPLVRSFSWGYSLATKPTLGTDGSSLILAHATVNGDLRVRYFSPSTGAAQLNVIGDPIGQIALSGIAVTNDPEVGHILWVSTPANSSTHVRAFGRTGAGSAALYSIPAPASMHIGLCGDGDRLWGASESYLWHFANPAWGAFATTLTAGYTWYDGNAADGTHETALSPTKSSTIKTGWVARVEASPAPHAGVTDPLQTDAAKLIRIYATDDAGSPTLQATLDEGVSAIAFVDDLPVATAPPAESTFAGTDNASGLVRTDREDDDGPLIRLEGDGAWRLGNFSADSTGAVTIDPSWTVQGGDPWHTVGALSNGWTFNNQSAYPVQYKRDIAGNLHIRGLINDTGTQGAAVFVLPDGWRPDMVVPYISLYAHSNGMATADVLPDGVVRVRQRTGTSGNFISLKMVLPLL